MSGDTLTRREILGALGGLALGAALGEQAVNAQEKRPNIIFIMTDDHAAHAVSCYGSRINKTPNIDRIAREGILFTNAFVTNALCAPSRASLLTGKYSHMNGQTDNTVTFDGSQMTFPKLLQKAGYRTGIVGKWHLKSDPTGFDYWNILPGQGMYRDPDLIEMGERKKHRGYVTDIITDLAMDFIGKTGDQPFCLLVHHKAPHRLWDPDEKHARLFEGKTIPEPETFNDDYTNRASAAAHADMRIADMPDYVDKGLPPNLSAEERKKWNYQRFIKDYLGTIASVDDNIGRLLDFLDRKGLAENTIVVYTADNGFFLGDHGWFDKRFMYEESLRVPLVIRYPAGVKPGSKTDAFALNVDYAPTFLDAAGAAVPGGVQGRSLMPLLEGERPDDWRTSMYYHYYEYPLSHRVREHYGVRDNRYKLIHYYTIDEWELFDLREDPSEMRNVYSDGSYADVVKKMKADLQRLRAELKVPETG